MMWTIIQYRYIYYKQFSYGTYGVLWVTIIRGRHSENVGSANFPVQLIACCLDESRVRVDHKLGEKVIIA